MAHHDDYVEWPFVSQEEFELACAYLDRKYIQAKLGETRLAFQLKPRCIASTGSVYLEILRLLKPPESLTDLKNAFDRLTFTANSRYECDMEVDCEEEENDKEVLECVDLPPKYTLYAREPYVIYEIHLHPTYRMPTLWFTLHDLGPNENVQDIETVYRHLVPPRFQSSVRSAGVFGGISAAPHPLTDIPSFFLHPCRTKEAMEGFCCPIEDYLMVWVGIVGGCVGLWLPHEMAEVR